MRKTTCKAAVAALTLAAAVAGCGQAPGGGRTLTLAGEARPDRAKWMGEARWGIMNHYLADWKAADMKERMTIEKWNQMIDAFDVEGLANQLQTLGVKYYLFTIGQNSGYFCSPNATYDKIIGIEPTKCSKRDLVGDIGAALQKRGIHFMVYLPAGAPGGDRVAVQKLEWQNGPNPNREFQLKWESVIRDWSTRWGTRVEGWWFDGCYFPNTMYRGAEAPNFESFAAAARAGNPNSAVAFNPGPVVRLVSQTPQEDYTAGEVTNPEQFIARRLSREGKVDGVQPHILTYIGEQWGRGKPKYTEEWLKAWTSRMTRTGAAITFDMPIEPSGLISKVFADQVIVIRDTVNATPIVPGSESSTRPAGTRPADAATQGG